MKHQHLKIVTKKTKNVKEKETYYGLTHHTQKILKQISENLF